jgi:hypothetical protein
MIERIGIAIVSVLFFSYAISDAEPPDPVPSPAKGVIVENTSPIPVNVNNTTPLPVQVPQSLAVNVANTPTVNSEQSGEWVVSLPDADQPDFSIRPDLRLPPTGRTIGGPGYETILPGESIDIFSRDTIDPSSDVIEVCVTGVNLGEANIQLAFEDLNSGGSVQTNLFDVLPGRTRTVCTPLQDDFDFLIRCEGSAADGIAVWRVDQGYVE